MNCPNPNIAVRADAGVTMGTGHVMRCLALAKEWRDRGGKITFLSHEMLPPLVSLLRAEPEFTLKMIPAVGHLPESNFDLLIVDHYGLDSQWEKEAKIRCTSLLAIDDLANRSHHCDFLLDQNYFPGEFRYRNLVPENCVNFLGPQYALLRPEFSLLRNASRGKVRTLKRILCFMGGTDPSNEITKVVRTLLELNSNDLEIGIITSSANPHLDQLKKLTDDHHNISLGIDVKDMAQATVGYDLAIAAGGSATWERLCLGIPTITISISPDQEPVSSALAQDGYLLYLGKKESVSKDEIAAAVLNLSNPEVRQVFKDKGQALVDGLGTKRVVTELNSVIRILT